jgi:hypothetical protein
MLQRRKLTLKAKFESGPPHLRFKRMDPGGFNTGLIGSTCTALPSEDLAELAAQAVAAQVEIESKI